MLRMRLLFAMALPQLLLTAARAQSSAANFRIGLIPPATYAVQGAPFAADLEASWTGGDTAQPGTAAGRVARDSAGSQRFEIGFADRQVLLYDIPRERIVRLNPETKVATVTPMTRVGKPVLVPVSKVEGAPAQNSSHPPGTPLETRTVAGLEALGTRTMTNWKNADGTSTQLPRDLWLSPAYRMPLMLEYENPRYRKVVERVTKLDPAEPDPALFTIPADYKIVEAPPATLATSKTAPPPVPATPVLAQREVDVRANEESVRPVPDGVRCTAGSTSFTNTGMNNQRNAAFSATVVRTIEQHLLDGNAVRSTVEVRQARDSTGKTMSELVLGCYPSEDGRTVPWVTVNIADPVARKTLSWQLGGGFYAEVVRVGQIWDPRTATPEETAEALEQRRKSEEWNRARSQLLQSETKIEQLGTKTIGDVLVAGVRTTRTIPPGEEGNDTPLVVTNESWTSRALGIAVYSMYDDPRRGKTTIEYKDIKLGDPDPSLFVPPASYKLVDDKPPQRSGG